MDYHVRGYGDALLNARITVTGGRITLHSRSGKRRGAPAGDRGRNPDYVAAFDVVFERLQPTGAINRVLLDSSEARKSYEEDRVLAIAADFQLSLEAAKRQVRARMRAFGRSADMPANEGNQNKKILIETSLSDADIVKRLEATPAPGGRSAPPPRPDLDLVPDAELRKVRPEHVRAALARLDAGETADFFGAARGYDVMTGEGRRYAPKHVFGFALEEAIGASARSGNFHAGWGTPCFEILEDCGLWIVPKKEGKERPRAPESPLTAGSKAVTLTDEEQSWIEGNPKIAVHLVKERQPGLAAKKRARFVADHGKLYCERCRLDPTDEYGEEAGAACIEVHHHRTHVAEMEPGNTTNLDDLRCLCANCHRVLHRALTLGVSFDIDLPRED